MVDLLNTAVSGLMAARSAITTTGHNIANVNTPYYSKQRLEVSASVAEPQSYGQIGRGVDMVSVSRSYDNFILQQVRSHNASVGRYETVATLTTQVSAALGDADMGLTPDLESFFGALHDMADSPALLSSRQTFLDTADNLATRIRDINIELNTQRDAVNTGIQNVVNEINSLAQSLASVNQDIAAADSSHNHQPNDLLDQRDKILADLSKLVGIRTVIENDGTLDIFVADGKALVMGGGVNKMIVSQSGFDPQDLTVRLEDHAEGVDLEDYVTDGQLGGYFDFRRNVLHPAQDGIGILAVGLAETLNEQHQQGMDLNGDLGGNLFKSGAPKIWAHTLNESEAVFSAELNHYTTSYELVCTDEGTLSTPPRPVYSLKRLSDGNLVATNFTLTNDQGEVTPFTIDGITITMDTGTAVNTGDRFLLEPNGFGSFSSQYNGNDAGTDAVFKTVALPTTDSSKLIRSDYKIQVTGVGGSANGLNAGNATISQPFVLDTTNMNLSNTVEIRFTSETTYDVWDATEGQYLAQGQAYSSGEEIPPSGDHNGWSVKITDGTLPIAAGDVFTVSAGYTVTRLSDRAEILADGDLIALNRTLRNEGLSVLMVGGPPKVKDSFLLQPTRRGAADFSLVLTDPRQLALAAPVTTIAQSTNLGSGVISAGTVVDSSREALQNKVEIRFTSDQTFDVYDLATETYLDRGVSYPPIVSVAHDNNFGTATITPPTVVDYNHDNLRDTLEVQFISSSQYNVVNLTTGETLKSGVPYTSGESIPSAGDYNGLQFTITGSPKAGDRFQVKSASENPIAYNGWAVNISGAPRGSMVASPSVNNRGTLTTTAPVMSATGYRAAKLDHTIELSFSGTDYTLTDMTDGTVIETNTYTKPTFPDTFTITAPSEYGGWSIGISGDALSGDKFTIKAVGDVFQVKTNQGGIGDGRNGQTLVDLQTKTQLMSGNDYRGVYTTIIAEVGSSGSHADSILKSQEALLSQSVASREARSGVNLDEEAADLMRFQQAYQASAQIIQSANTLFSSLLSAVRG